MPPAGVAASHAASSDVEKLNVPPPVLVTDSDCAGGAAAPSTALNVRPDGATASCRRDGEGRRRRLEGRCVGRGGGSDA